MAEEISLLDVLAESSQVTTAAQNWTPMTSAYYDPASIWAVVAFIRVTHPELKLYKGQDPHGNQIAFLSNRPPKTRARRGAPPASSATVFRQGSITYNNLAQVDVSSLEEKHFIAGQLMADDAKFTDLKPAERQALEARLAELEGVSQGESEEEAE